MLISSIPKEFNVFYLNKREINLLRSELAKILTLLLRIKLRYGYNRIKFGNYIPVNDVAFMVT